MVSNDGAKQAMEWLFESSDDKTHLQTLKDNGFEKEDIVKMVSNGGAKQAMEWLCKSSDDKTH